MLSVPATMARCRLDRRVSATMVSTTCSRSATEQGCTIGFSLRYPGGWSGDAPCAGNLRVVGGGRLAAHIELDFARQLYDRFRMVAVLEQCIFDGLRTVDEQAAIETILLLRDPLAALVLADEDDVEQGTARWRFDKLHVSVPSGIE